VSETTQRSAADCLVPCSESMFCWPMLMPEDGAISAKLLRRLPQVRLPFKDLPNGAIEVEDEEGGDYCVPARAPGTPPPPGAATNSS